MLLEESEGAEKVFADAAGGIRGNRKEIRACCCRNLREQKKYSQMLLEESEGAEKVFADVAGGI